MQSGVDRRRFTGASDYLPFYGSCIYFLGLVYNYKFPMSISRVFTMLLTCPKCYNIDIHQCNKESNIMLQNFCGIDVGSGVAITKIILRPFLGQHCNKLAPHHVFSLILIPNICVLMRLILVLLMMASSQALLTIQTNQSTPSIDQYYQMRIICTVKYLKMIISIHQYLQRL